jgi:ribokinase
VTAGAARPRVAVAGHIEWITHGVGLMPRPGEISYLGDPFDEPAGGGGVSAAQVAKLGAETLSYTALGSDEAGRASAERLGAIGVTVLASVHGGRHTRGVSAVGPSGDRAILIIGGPTSARIDDPLPWDELARCDAAFFTGHDSATVAAARRARALVVTSRRLAQLVESGVRADVLVASASDPSEAVDPDDLPVAPAAIAWTEGARGGRYTTADGRSGRWDPAPLPGPPVDSYGSGDSFAAGLTVGLGRGLDLEGALALGARCGAHCITGRGALAAQLEERGAPA